MLLCLCLQVTWVYGWISVGAHGLILCFCDPQIKLVHYLVMLDEPSHWYLHLVNCSKEGSYLASASLPTTSGPNSHTCILNYLPFLLSLSALQLNFLLTLRLHLPVSACHSTRLWDLGMWTMILLPVSIFALYIHKRKTSKHLEIKHYYFSMFCMFCCLVSTRLQNSAIDLHKFTFFSMHAILFQYHSSSFFLVNSSVSHLAHYEFPSVLFYSFTTYR